MADTQQVETYRVKLTEYPLHDLLDHYEMITIQRNTQGAHNAEANHEMITMIRKEITNRLEAK